MNRPAEDTLFSENDLFENAFHHAAIGMALVGLKGEFLKVNRSMCDLVGYSDEELRSLTFQQLTYPEDLESDLAQLRQLLAREIPGYRMEKRYMTRTGAIVWVLLTVSLVPSPEGQPLFFIAQIMDITPRKEAEREILNLRSKLLTICAWTKRVRCNDTWMSVDEFLTNELGLNLTHGMSAEAEAEFMKGGITP